MKEVFILSLIVYDEDTQCVFKDIYGVYSTYELAKSFEAVARAENSDDTSVISYSINRWAVV